MWIYSCFDGDEDMALAGVQHDLYFGMQTVPGIWLDGCSTLAYLWAMAIWLSPDRGHPWLRRNYDRMLRLQREGFSHKLLQVPHEHMAAYYRWTMPRVQRRSVVLPEKHGPYPMDLLEGWKDFLRKEVPDLLSTNEALLSLAKSMVYRNFDEGERAYCDFQDVLMRRYGFECVAQMYWAEDVARRVGLPIPEAIEGDETCREREMA